MYLYKKFIFIDIGWCGLCLKSFLCPLPGRCTVCLQRCFDGNTPEAPSSSEAASEETLGCTWQDKKNERNLLLVILTFTSYMTKTSCVCACGWVCPQVHRQEKWQTDELRQTHGQVQGGPGAAEPGQWGHAHRPQAKAEGQEG